MATKKRKAGGRRRAVVIVNSPKRRRARRRGNPPAFSVGGIVSRVTNGVVGGAVIVATEAGTRLVRGRVLGMPAGEMLSGLTEIAISTTAGIVAEKFVGARIAQTIIDAGFASVFRATAKQMETPWVADALGDDSRRQSFVIRGGRAFPANGRLAGYVPGNRGPTALGGYVSGAAEGAASRMVNGT